MGHRNDARTGSEERILESDDLRLVTKNLRSFVGEISLGLFGRHREVLLRESADYIVPAVWGPHEGDQLDGVQRYIHSSINPEVERIVNSLKTSETTSPQEFGLTFLVRELILWKLCFLREYAQNQILVREEEYPDESEHDLEHMIPEGNA